MLNPSITLVVNGNPYCLKGENDPAIEKIAIADRKALIRILEAIKKTESKPVGLSSVSASTVEKLSPKHASIQKAQQRVPTNVGSKVGQIKREPLARASETSPENSETVSQESVGAVAKPERLGAGDVDALMAKLIAEEKQNKRPGITKSDIYKWFAVTFVGIIVLAYFS